MRLLRNMGSTDRALRGVGVATVALLIASGKVDGMAAVALGAFGAAMAFSGLSGHCPLYVPFGVSTCERPA